MELLNFAVLVSLMLVVGYATDPKSGEGFTLSDGDFAKGQATFARHPCNAFHTVTLHAVLLTLVGSPLCDLTGQPKAWALAFVQNSSR
jgi:hypothetical protein